MSRGKCIAGEFYFKYLYITTALIKKSNIPVITPRTASVPLVINLPCPWPQTTTYHLLSDTYFSIIWSTTKCSQTMTHGINLAHSL